MSSDATHSPLTSDLPEFMSISFGFVLEHNDDPMLLEFLVSHRALLDGDSQHVWTAECMRVCTFCLVTSQICNHICPLRGVVTQWVRFGCYIDYVPAYWLRLPWVSSLRSYQWSVLQMDLGQGWNLCAFDTGRRRCGWNADRVRLCFHGVACNLLGFFVLVGDVRITHNNYP